MMRADVKRLNEVQQVWLDQAGEPMNIDRAWQKSDKRIAVRRRDAAMLAAAGMDGPEARWYVLQVKKGFDIPVEKSLENANVECWMPSKFIDQPHHGGRKGPKPEPKKVSFLPGYLFVKVVWCATCWAGLMSIKGVAGVIGGAERPSPVSADRILKLRAFIESDPEAIDVLTNALKKGEKVRVDDGPFASFPGVVEKVYYNGRALIEVMIFGRAVSVRMGLAQISKSE